MSHSRSNVAGASSCSHSQHDHPLPATPEDDDGRDSLDLIRVLVVGPKNLALVPEFLEYPQLAEVRVQDVGEEVVGALRAWLPDLLPVDEERVVFDFDERAPPRTNTSSSDHEKDFDVVLRADGQIRLSEGPGPLSLATFLTDQGRRCRLRVPHLQHGGELPHYGSQTSSSYNSDAQQREFPASSFSPAGVKLDLGASVDLSVGVEVGVACTTPDAQKRTQKESTGRMPRRLQGAMADDSNVETLLSWVKFSIAEGAGFKSGACWDTVVSESGELRSRHFYPMLFYHGKCLTT